MGSNDNRYALWWLPTALLVLSAVPHAHAVEVGDAAKGRIYADQVCGKCHAIDKSEIRSPLSTAPTFKSIAEKPGMNRTALRLFFRTWHPSMPNFMLEEETTDNLISYIKSLADEVQ